MAEEQKHPHTHPEHYETAYSENAPKEEFDPTKLGDAEHHPEHFHTAYEDNPGHHVDPTTELGDPEYSDTPEQ